MVIHGECIGRQLNLHGIIGSLFDKECQDIEFPQILSAHLI